MTYKVRVMLRKVVIEQLSKPSESDPSKTLGEALIDGTFTKDEILDLHNKNIEIFGGNSSNQKKLPEGAYSMQEAIHEFVETIGPFLSEKRLFEITDAFCYWEVSAQDAYRTSTVGKEFFLYELKKHPGVEPPEVFLAHFKHHISPFLEKKATGESKYINFITFNFNPTFRLAGIEDKIKSFDLESFSPDNLSTETIPDAKKKFREHIQSAKEEYNRANPHAKIGEPEARAEAAVLEPDAKKPVDEKEKFSAKPAHGEKLKEGQTGYRRQQVKERLSGFFSRSKGKKEIEISAPSGFEKRTDKVTTEKKSVDYDSPQQKRLEELLNTITETESIRKAAADRYIELSSAIRAFSDKMDKLPEPPKGKEPVESPKATLRKLKAELKQVKENIELYDKKIINDQDEMNQLNKEIGESKGSGMKPS